MPINSGPVTTPPENILVSSFSFHFRPKSGDNTYDLLFMYQLYQIIRRTSIDFLKYVKLL